MIFLLVAIDYFKRWVEVEALGTIIEAKIHNFVWKNIVCKFRIPKTIIFDNGCQFESQVFYFFYLNLSIENTFSS